MNEIREALWRAVGQISLSEPPANGCHGNEYPCYGAVTAAGDLQLWRDLSYRESDDPGGIVEKEGDPVFVVIETAEFRSFSHLPVITVYDQFAYKPDARHGDPLYSTVLKRWFINPDLTGDALDNALADREEEIENVARAILPFMPWEDHSPRARREEQLLNQAETA